MKRLYKSALKTILRIGDKESLSQNYNFLFSVLIDKKKQIRVVKRVMYFIILILRSLKPFISSKINTPKSGRKINNDKIGIPVIF